MRWEDRIGDLFDDLEQQAEGLALAERDAEVAEQSRAEYAQVDLSSRLHASLGSRLLLDVGGVGPLDAVLHRVGEGWCLLGAGPREWIVQVDAIGSVRGLSGRAATASSRPVTARLGLASALRGVADTRAEAVLHLRDGSLRRGTLGRVGADFAEIAAEEGPISGLVTVPFAALAAVRSD